MAGPSPLCGKAVDACFLRGAAPIAARAAISAARLSADRRKDGRPAPIARSAAASFGGSVSSTLLRFKGDPLAARLDCVRNALAGHRSSQG